MRERFRIMSQGNTKNNVPSHLPLFATGKTLTYSVSSRLYKLFSGMCAVVVLVALALFIGYIIIDLSSRMNVKHMEPLGGLQARACLVIN